MRRKVKDKAGIILYFLTINKSQGKTKTNTVFDCFSLLYDFPVCSIQFQAHAWSMSLSAIVWLVDMFLKVLGQQWRSMAQKEKYI